MPRKSSYAWHLNLCGAVQNQTHLQQCLNKDRQGVEVIWALLLIC